MKKVYMIACLVVMIALLAMPANAVASAGPDVDTWFTWKKENSEWHDWVGCTQENKSILYNLQLKVGQPVKCRIRLKTYHDCSIAFCLSEPGDLNAYNVTKGHKIDETVGYPKVYANSTTSYIWELKPNGEWTGGNAPINVYWEVSYATTVDKSQESGSWAFANPTIIDEEWQGGDSGNGGGDNGKDKDNDNDGIPGFESASLGVAMLIALAVWQMKRKRWRE